MRLDFCIAAGFLALLFLGLCFLGDCPTKRDRGWHRWW